MLSVLEQTIYGAALMLWETLWALVLGFGLSAVLQVVVRRESITRHFGQANLRSVGLATFFGAVSSSCSYAAAAAAKSAFQKGAHLVPTLAFMFAATNLVLELGVVLWILLGWRFVLAEVVGAFVLIGLMWLLVTLTLPRGLVEEARRHGKEEDEEESCCHGPAHEHDHAGHKSSTGLRMAEAFFMDVSMMWKEILIGFLIAGFLMAAVPPDWWKGLFLTAAPWPVRLIENALVGVLIAVASFVCSVGNLPLAALLWSGGIGFGGVIAFIYGDLVIVPLLLIYRKYYGLRAAAYIAAILAVSMIGAGIVVDLLFAACGLIPAGPRPPAPVAMAHFAWNYTTWLDLLALAVLAFLAGWRVFPASPARSAKEADPSIPRQDHQPVASK
jgi:uncharacterized membrane protein YraQ (UPF0718 family)